MTDRWTDGQTDERPGKTICLPTLKGGDIMMLSKSLSIKKGCYICQWLDNVDMHLYAKFDQNMSCVSSAMSIYSLTEDGHTD